MPDTIHDAIDALFASKATETPTAEPPAAAPAAATETPKASPAEPAKDDAPTDGDEKPSAATEEPPPAEKPVEKVSAADYALLAARARKKLAAAAAATKASEPPAPVPSADAIKRAAAIEAAGDDPLKAFEAAGLDLAKVVKAYDERVENDPENPDPLAEEVKQLAEKIAMYEKREQEAEDARITANFFATARTVVKDNDAYESVAAYGDEALELVKQLVVQAHAGNKALGIPPRMMPLAEALAEAEAHYRAVGEKLAKTKWLAKLVQPQTRKPGIGNGNSPAPPAPPKSDKTKPTTVQDVIKNEIEALLGPG